MRLMIVALVALALVGCGGSKGPTGPITVDELASRAGCTTTDKYGDALTPTAGTCILPGGGKLGLATFADHATRDAWALFNRTYGYRVETGDLWAVTGEDEGVVKAAAAVIRG